MQVDGVYYLGGHWLTYCSSLQLSKRRRLVDEIVSIPSNKPMPAIPSSSRHIFMRHRHPTPSLIPPTNRTTSQVLRVACEVLSPLSLVKLISCCREGSSPTESARGQSQKKRQPREETGQRDRGRVEQYDWVLFVLSCRLPMSCCCLMGELLESLSFSLSLSSSPRWS